jgi:hypothetical protein
VIGRNFGLGSTFMPLVIGANVPRFIFVLRLILDKRPAE